jgi:hypothetical protein
MANTNHTPAQQDIEENDRKDVEHAEKARTQELDKSKDSRNNGDNGNPAQSAGRPNSRTQDAHPEPMAEDDGNSTTGKGSVEQDDEDIGGDQDREPNPKIAPAVTVDIKDAIDDEGKEK